MHEDSRAPVARTEYEQQPRFVIEYIGGIMYDARQIAGVWHSMHHGKIARLQFQQEVVVRYPYGLRLEESDRRAVPLDCNGP